MNRRRTSDPDLLSARRAISLALEDIARPATKFDGFRSDALGGHTRWTQLLAHGLYDTIAFIRFAKAPRSIRSLMRRTGISRAAKWSDGREASCLNDVRTMLAARRRFFLSIDQRSRTCLAFLATVCFLCPRASMAVPATLAVSVRGSAKDEFNALQQTRQEILSAPPVPAKMTVVVIVAPDQSSSPMVAYDNAMRADFANLYPGAAMVQVPGGHKVPLTHPEVSLLRSARFWRRQIIPLRNKLKAAPRRGKEAIDTRRSDRTRLVISTITDACANRPQ